MDHKKRKVNENAGLSESLLKLEENKKRVENEREYFDEEKDKRIINIYYQNICFDKVNQKELFIQLNELVTNTHDNQLPYDTETRNYLYSWADLHIDGNLKSIYSGEIMDPKQVISEDYKADRKRKEAFDKLLKSGEKYDAVIRQTIASIESQIMYNCEHVVPQSWFNKDNPMRGDLHHLFTCEIKCNSTRSNYPYYDFPDYSPKMEINTIKTKCGKYEDNQFEPESGKGNVARATLYFLLRYPSEISQYSSEDIKLLLKWHKDYKVSIYEKHRNKAIFEIQKNRNPLIDYPQYADKIDFKLGLS